MKWAGRFGFFLLEKWCEGKSERSRQQRQEHFPSAQAHAGGIGFPAEDGSGEGPHLICAGGGRR